MVPVISASALAASFEMMRIWPRQTKLRFASGFLTRDARNN
jgi:hypothetical protein